MQISAIKIDKFKRLWSVEFGLAEVTVLIGGNNSEKSSLLQGIHIAITTLQSARTASTAAQPVSTLGIDQFLYKPSSQPIRLHHRSHMTSKSGPEFTFTYSDNQTDDPKEFGLVMRRGKNANIAITFDHENSFYERASDRTRPLSIFVPGLAGGRGVNRRTPNRCHCDRRHRARGCKPLPSQRAPTPYIRGAKARQVPCDH